MTTSDIAALALGHRPGQPLPRALYTDPGIFELDMERVLLRHWFCCTHESAIPQPGDYVTVDLGKESVIVVRGADGAIRALLNVCRHRGSRICYERAGHAPASRLTCPYHAWSYGLDGRLLAARQMSASFHAAQITLKVLPVEVVEGLIFTTFAAQPLDFAAAEAGLRQAAGVHGWAQAKIAHRELYAINANWKLAVENYMECYHCAPAHGEFARRHAYARPAPLGIEIEQAGRARARALGIAVADLDRYGLGAGRGEESVAVMRSALYPGFQSASEDGAPVSRPMGAFAACDGNSTYFDVGPISDFLAYADHGLIYRFIPRAAAHTEMEVLWLVHRDAVEGEDYDLERLTWLWKATSAQDKKIVEMNHAGVESRYYQPGDYSEQESYASRFVEWYLAELRDAAPSALP